MDDVLTIKKLTAKITTGYLINHDVAVENIPTLMRTVYSTLMDLGNEPVAAEEPKATLTPAVPIRKSVTAEYIVCLEDGKKLKMLKRHLSTAYNMTPEEYRDKWSLPPDYPMVAPAYASQRSELAKQIGLGRRHGRTRPPTPEAEPIRRGPGRPRRVG